MEPFFDKQLGVVEVCDNLADLWGQQNHVFSEYHVQNRWETLLPLYHHLSAGRHFSQNCGTTVSAISKVKVLLLKTFLGHIFRHL